MHHDSNGTGQPPAFPLARDAAGRLSWTDAQGQTHHDVEAVRAFPISAPQHDIALCSRDGRELHWIDDLEQIPQPMRQWIEFSLAHRQFVPTVLRIINVSRVVEPSEWEVETDRGLTRFSLRNAEDVRRLAGHRALVTDTYGIRYLIPDLRALDPLSSRILERYL